ncbi:MAG: hypothetical protein RL133_1070 [Pseudomonadota bacterium]
MRHTTPCSLVWIRRDLRLEDHAALAHALRHPEPVAVAFVFDEAILAPLRSDPQALQAHGLTLDRRVAFIHASLEEVDQTLSRMGSQLFVLHGQAHACIPELAQSLKAVRVVCAHDDEPQARSRDAVVEQTLAARGIAFETVKDHCVFERQEVLTGAGKFFSVFTPYKNAWLKRLAAQPQAIEPHETRDLADRCVPAPAGSTHRLPRLGDMGFAAVEDLASLRPGPSGAQALLSDFLPRLGHYKEARDFPGKRGPSYLSVHLRFGTISICQLVRQAQAVIQSSPSEAEGAQTWLSELIWRDFYIQILSNAQHVTLGAFKPEYNRIEWLEAGPEFEQRFAAWCEGRTGYPLVDAGMRQLNTTGYMHNRLRMVVASFLTKDLGIHWQCGERYFALRLNDFDLSANNGGWQWAASTGCDAQPYFRIFNPVSQSEKFDPKGQFIRRYVPELARLPDAAMHAPWEAGPLILEQAGVRLGEAYPHPIVDHAQARAETLARFAVVKRA